MNDREYLNLFEPLFLDVMFDMYVKRARKEITLKELHEFLKLSKIKYATFDNIVISYANVNNIDLKSIESVHEQMVVIGILKGQTKSKTLYKGLLHDCIKYVRGLDKEEFEKLSVTSEELIK